MEIKKKIRNVHDKTYKSFFENKEIFIELLQSFVKEKWTTELKKEDLHQDSTRYIVRDYDEMEADVVYTATINNQEVVFITLLEFQSTVDHTMPIRLFWYMSEIWRKYIKQIDKKIIEKKDFKLPVIVPIVLYNGAEKWEVSTSFKDKLQQADLFGNHALNFEYVLININKYSEEQLMKIENIVSAIFLLDQKIDAEEFVKRAGRVAKEFENLKDEHRLRLTDWIDQIIVESKSKSLVELFKTKLSKEEVDEMTANITITLQEEKEQAKKVGLEQGLEQGEKRKALEVANNLLKMGMDIEAIMKATGLSKEEIEELR